MTISVLGVGSAAVSSSADTAVDPDQASGQAMGWGLNDVGQVGDSTGTSRDRPVEVRDLANAVDIGAGDGTSIAVRPDGTVWTWGYNWHGELGDGSHPDDVRGVPGRVPGLDGVTAVATGWGHHLTVREDGTVWAWGSNSYGQIGTGDKLPVDTPVRVKGLTEVVAVAAGGEHSVALKQDGSVWAWGQNMFGQLGNGTTTWSETRPVRAEKLPPVEAVSAGAQFTLALTRDGRVWGWGLNMNGQLGDGSDVDRATPVEVPGLTGITEIATGTTHSLAVDEEGALFAWGGNGQGELGDGTTADRRRPIRIDLPAVRDVDGGYMHSLAATRDGRLYGWGTNNTGQLGIGGTADQHAPTRADGVDQIRQVVAGYQHSLAVLGSE